MAKLKIIRCSIEASKIEPKSGAANTFEATINPESYSHNFSLKYTGTMGKGDGAVGKSGAIPKYSMADPEKMSFSLTVDGTGVVPDAADLTVADQIDQLRTVCYDYDGDEHEPTAVKIIWGNGLKEFFGRLTDMSVDYTLFSPDGTALRAKIKLNFIEARTAAQEALEAKRRSPDLTHVIRVQSGDTLPLLCHRIYKDAGKYLEIAAFNDLDNFRDLEPNTLLRFPPMR
ncbi:peptidoglycan-binding protein [uncultured Roseobacter sp.]|uniref:CIS tube protein n=1 Tax=uncultured Roseobacter sp. TaxID=114847 RepID=UPI002618EE62|nr:peptidoglycan-binding protein [uncultured Roseobacter sp.]